MLATRDAPLARSSPLRDADRPARVAARRPREWWSDEDLVGHVEFDLARDVETFDGAFRLIHDQYVSRGYMAPRPSGRRLNLHNALPTTKVFVATVAARVVGTVTLVEDSSLGLPMDEIYASELERFRRARRCLGEVSGLATDPGWRSLGLAILVRLMRMLVVYAAKVAGLDSLCIAVNPRHVGFYRRCLRFRQFGELKSFAKVNGAPAVALSLDLVGVRALIDRARDGSGAGDGLVDFFCGAESYRRVMERLCLHLAGARLTAEQFSRLFADGLADPPDASFGMLDASPICA